MIAVPLTPQLTIEWFERIDMKYEALCIFLIANSMHRNIIMEFIQNHAALDPKMVERIGFVVSDSEFSASQGVATSRGRRFCLPGEVVQPRSCGPILKIASEEDSSGGFDESSIEMQRLSGVTARSNQEWAEFFSIQKTQLPVLCLLIKGCDPVSIGLNEDISPPVLHRLLGGISEVADCDSRMELLAISQFNSKFARFSELSGRRTEKEKELVKLFDVLAKISEASDQDKEKIAEWILSKRYSMNEIERLLKALDFYVSPEFKHRKTIAGVRNKSRAIEVLLAEMDKQIPSHGEWESIGEAVGRISERRDKILSFLKDLAKDNYLTFSVDRSRITRRYDPYCIRFDEALNVGEKFSSRSSECKGADMLFAKLMSFADS